MVMLQYRQKTVRPLNSLRARMKADIEVVQNLQQTSKTEIWLHRYDQNGIGGAGWLDQWSFSVKMVMLQYRQKTFRPLNSLRARMKGDIEVVQNFQQTSKTEICLHFFNETAIAEICSFSQH